ncbi:MAG: hypothetical protein Kow00124_27620 [Anaerolineae bacterium]
MNHSPCDVFKIQGSAHILATNGGVSTKRYNRAAAQRQAATRPLCPDQTHLVIRQRSRPSMTAPSEPGKRSSLLPWLIAAIPAALAAAVYWPTLHLPLLYDTYLHIRIAENLNFASVWLPTEAFGYYRPFTFFPLLVIKALWGSYPAPVLHGINLLQHALNAALLALLSWRLWRRAWWALGAGLLFALYPFAYQAVAVYGHNVHLEIAGLMLLGLHTYLWARGDQPVRIAGLTIGRGAWWAVTAIIFARALLTHESAVLFGPFAALVEWSRSGQFPLSRRELFRVLRAPWAIFTLLSGVYAVVYQMLPLTRTPQADVAGSALWPKTLYLLQSAAYPVEPLSRFLPPLPAAVPVMAGLAVTLALTAWWLRCPDLRPVLALGWGWWGLAALLIAIPLSTGYLLHGPRLLYVGGIGLAVLWPALLDGRGSHARLLPSVLLALVLTASGLFIAGRLAAYRALARPVDLLREVMQGRGEDEGVLLINLPAWTSPARRTFPAGVEITSILGEYLFAEELVAGTLGMWHPTQAVLIPELLETPGGYYYGVHDQHHPETLSSGWARGGSQVIVTWYEESGPQPRHTGGFEPAPPGAEPLAQFGPYALLGAEAVRCGAEVEVTLLWMPDSGTPPPATLTVFVHLLDEAGGQIGQVDGPPLSLRPDRITVTPGWVIRDLREIAAEGNRPAAVRVGVYDFTTGERLPGAGPDSLPLPNDALQIPVTTCQSQEG